jgi:hypothetical protein
MLYQFLTKIKISFFKSSVIFDTGNMFRFRNMKLFYRKIGHMCG